MKWLAPGLLPVYEMACSKLAASRQRAGDNNNTTARDGHNRRRKKAVGEVTEGAPKSSSMGAGEDTLDPGTMGVIRLHCMRVSHGH